MLNDQPNSFGLHVIDPGFNLGRRGGSTSRIEMSADASTWGVGWAAYPGLKCQQMNLPGAWGGQHIPD